MSEMINRVAKALHESFDFMRKDDDCIACKKLARIAIEAMKEPTEAIINAGAYDSYMTLEQRWRNMIKVAIEND
jgi:hypothetical protein